MFSVKKLFKGLLLTVFACSFVKAQQLRFSHITEDQGLSQRNVNCVFQDSRGFIWIGTQDGLNKYDGYEIKVFKHNPFDTNSISNNFIECILQDHNGKIWIGTQNGLDIYDLSTNKFSHINDKIIQDRRIKTIFQDTEKNIWLGTDKGLNKLIYSIGKVESYVFEIPEDAILSSESVWSIQEDKSGVIWLASYGNYFYSFDKKSKKFSHYKLIVNGQEIEKAKSVRKLVYNEVDNSLLIGSEAGMFEFNIDTKVVSDYFHELAEDINKRIISNRVSSIYQDDSRIWVGCIYGGLNIINRKTGEILKYTNVPDDNSSLNDNNIRCLFFDKNKSVWIGSDNGINVLFEGANKFQHFKNFGPGGDQVNVYSILVDKNDVVYIGTNGYGLLSYDGEKKLTYTHENLPAGRNKSVLSILEDNGGLWIGTWGDGIKYYDLQTYRVRDSYSLTNLGSNSKGDILSIIEGENNELWIGTYGQGLIRLNKKNKEITQYLKKDGLSSNYIYCLYFDKEKGQLWVGTEANGLDLISTSNFSIEHFVKNKNDSNSLSSNSINCLFKDLKGNLWIGTSNGLNMFKDDRKSFMKIFEKDGLVNDYIYGIMQDGKGCLWLSTNNGISRYNPNVENINGSAFRNFQVSDGLQGKEFNQGAFFKSKNGEMFFGGTNGYNSFYPDQIVSNLHKPEVYITDFKLFGKSILLDTNVIDKKYIELSWKENFLAFEFVALDYLMPLQNKYSYMLVGVDEDWSVPNTNRIASYTQLEPGNYVFKVKAANSDGVWNEEGTSVVIHIIPPFWKTKWFYTLCVLAFITGVFGFIRWRTSSIKKEKKILEEKVEERTRELAEKNRDITSSIQYAKRIQEAILPPVDTIFSHFPDSFILYKPKDIVSGDFYWFAEKNGKKIIAAVDCTGHGVPGAFMSMIGHNLLNQIVIENGFTDPATILNELHKGVQAALKQGSNVVDTSDGMDVALCCFDEKMTQVTYAGAFRPMFFLSGDTLERISGNKFPIGGSTLDLDRRFTNHKRFLNKGDRIYLFSDGYADQFGGENGKKFMMKRFSEMLVSSKNAMINEQISLLDNTIREWMKGYEQVDDILVIGIAV